MFTKIRKKALGIHPLLLYYHDLRKTFAAMMQNARIRGIPHLPSPLLRAPAIIHFFEPDKKSLIEHHILTEEEYEEMDKHARDIAVAAMQFADASPWPDPITLEEGVFAPKEEGLHG